MVLLISARSKHCNFNSETIGILTQVAKAKEKTIIAKDKELLAIAVQASYGENGKLNIERIEENFDKISEIQKLNVSNFPMIVSLHNNKFKIDEKGKVEEVIAGSTLLETLNVGDYICYETNELSDFEIGSEYTGYGTEGEVQIISPSSYDKGWQVAYIDKEKEEIEIISSDTTQELTLYGKKGYQYLVYTLNRISEAYMTENAYSARHIGSNPDNPSDGEVISDELMADGTRVEETKDGNIYIDGGESDNEEATCRIPSSLRAIGKDYFAASRLGWRIDYSVYEARIFNGEGEKQWMTIASAGGYNQYARTFGIRPIITLKPNFYIVDGDGSSLQDAYVISFDV